VEKRKREMETSSSEKGAKKETRSEYPIDSLQTKTGGVLEVPKGVRRRNGMWYWFSVGKSVAFKNKLGKLNAKREKSPRTAEIKEGGCRVNCTGLSAGGGEQSNERRAQRSC